MLYNSKKLGLIIAAERIKRKMTQEQLSSRASISRSHLAAIECGQKKPKIDTLWRIAEALSVKLSNLIAMMENDNNHPDNLD